MNYIFEVCLIAMTLIGITPSIAAQSGAEVPMQRGISVDLPVTNNAIAVPDADKEDALVVTVTYDGSVYLGDNTITATVLPEKVKRALSGRIKKTLYIKADARAPYAKVVQVLDAMRAAGVEGLTLLTAQRNSSAPGTLISPKGLAMELVQPRGLQPTVTK